MHRRSCLTLLAVGLALLAAVTGDARAQVNAESLRRKPLRPGLGAALEASFALAQGNVELLDFGATGRVQYQTLFPEPPAPPSAPPPVPMPPATGAASQSPPVAAPAPAPAPSSVPALPFVRQRLFLSASGRFAKQGGVTFLSQAFVHARWTAMWHRRIGTDLFGQYQYNEFLRLLVRGIGGGGARVEAVHHPRFFLWGGAGYLFEYNRIRVAPGATDAPETYEHRLTTYLTGRLSLFRDQLLLQNTLYWQPRVDAFSDVRVLEECEAQVRITDLLSLGVTVSVLYDSAPPTAVQTTDLRLFTALKIEI